MNISPSFPSPRLSRKRTIPRHIRPVSKTAAAHPVNRQNGSNLSGRSTSSQLILKYEESVTGAFFAWKLENRRPLQSKLHGTPGSVFLLSSFAPDRPFLSVWLFSALFELFSALFGSLLRCSAKAPAILSHKAGSSHGTF